MESLKRPTTHVAVGISSLDRNVTNANSRRDLINLHLLRNISGGKTDVVVIGLEVWGSGATFTHVLANEGYAASVFPILSRLQWTYAMGKDYSIFAKV